MRMEYAYEEDYFDEKVANEYDLSRELDDLKRRFLYIREELEDHVEEEILVDLFGEWWYNEFNWNSIKERYLLSY